MKLWMSVMKMTINVSVIYMSNDSVVALFQDRTITITMLNHETLRIEIKYESDLVL